MVRRRQRERSLFEVLLPDGHKLWPDWLRRIDTLLGDEASTITSASTRFIRCRLKPVNVRPRHLYNSL